MAGVGESDDWDVEGALREVPAFDSGDAVYGVIGALSSVEDIQQIHSKCSVGQRIHHVVAEQWHFVARPASLAHILS